MELFNSITYLALAVTLLNLQSLNSLYFKYPTIPIRRVIPVQYSKFGKYRDVHPPLSFRIFLQGLLMPELAETPTTYGYLLFIPVLLYISF